MISNIPLYQKYYAHRLSSFLSKIRPMISLRLITFSKCIHSNEKNDSIFGFDQENNVDEAAYRPS